ncbi:MAG: ribonuclease P protein component [Lachnospiraceae bacterium]|nr:ribonuclease P protein component [Lachnospiraceae bacterium]
MSSIRKPELFRLLYRKGKHAGGRTLVLYAMPNGKREPRLGITISRKNGNSVVRHRFMRIVREVFRTEREALANDADYMVVMKRDVRILHARELRFSEIRQELLPLLKRIKGII